MVHIQAQEELEQLHREVICHNQQYYALDDPLISNLEYHACFSVY